MQEVFDQHFEPDKASMVKGGYGKLSCLGTVILAVTVDESIREDERSNDEEKDENVKEYICQLLDQRTASQRRDKSCTPSH